VVWNTLDDKIGEIGINYGQIRKGVEESGGEKEKRKKAHLKLI
jgi:hypothetical protein